MGAPYRLSTLDDAHTRYPEASGECGIWMEMRSDVRKTMPGN
jgi:hypothetical protein